LPLNHSTIITLHQILKQINAETIAVYFAALLGRRLYKRPDQKMLLELGAAVDTDGNYLSTGMHVW
jgi:hypothetical protein